MTRLAANSRRAGFTLIELLVVIAIMTILIALLIPAVQQVRNAAQRTQTTNNLHQCSLAALTFHDANGWLPYNGTGSASGVTDSGSWAYQILPYIEQGNVFNSQTSTALPPSWGAAISTLLDPMRGRPGFFSGGIAPSLTLTLVPGTQFNGTINPTTITVVGIGSTGTMTLTPSPPPLLGTGFTSALISTSVTNGASGTISLSGGGPAGGLTSSSFPIAGNGLLGPIGQGSMTVTFTITGGMGTSYSGPATDFGINPFLNVPSGGTVSAANNRCTLLKITDGTSNTILLGDMYCATTDYAGTAPSAATTLSSSTKLPIFIGGTSATTRNGLGNSTITWLQDGVATTSNQWGSPMPNGAMMAMADGSVHLIPYTTPLTNLLEPNDGNTVVIP